jgi:hypothetical protein
MEEDKLGADGATGRDGGPAALLVQAQFAALCEDFGRIADSFRMDERSEGQQPLCPGRGQLQTFFRIVQEALL